MNRPSSMIVAGIMSGTSADGIDIALVRISSREENRVIPVSSRQRLSSDAFNPGLSSSGLPPRLTLLAHRAHPFSRPLRHAILSAMAGQSNAPNTTTEEIARLHWRLGLAYAEALRETISGTRIRPALIGCHGQTVYHQGSPALYAARRFSCTWQLGEAAVIAAECRTPVVSNFRPADMAAGGQGAPLVPLFDYAYFAHPNRARVLQNIGGIANLTLIPAAAPINRVVAFDTGPGNMIIDALTQQLFDKTFDRNGHIAARGQVLKPILAAALKEKFFQLIPPKSAGREQFGAAYAAKFLAACRRLSPRPEDAIATATALTATTISDAIRRWVYPKAKDKAIDLIVSGGGARNATLLAMLGNRLVFGASAQDISLTTIDEMGLPSEAKEAAAFALLAYQTWHHQAGNVPSATGAKRPAILGQIIYA